MGNFNTLVQALQQQATEDKSVTFIEGKEKESIVEFSELYQRSLHLLHDFQKKGLKPGDELIIFLRNNEAFVCAFWAAILGGIVPVPVAVGISDEHRSKFYKIFSKLNKPFVFTDDDNIKRLEKYAGEHYLYEQYEAVGAVTILKQNSDQYDRPGEIHQPGENDICFIQFSSGSTSDPKGVVLTHKNIILNVLAKAKAGGYQSDEVALSWMPLTHDMGLIGFHINMIVCAMDHCIMSTDLFSRRPSVWLQKVSEHRANVICSPNFGYKHYLKALGDKTPEDIDLSCVRVILNGAEPISTKLCDEFIQRMAPLGLKQTAMLPVYGLAEATLAVAFSKLNQHFRSVSIDRAKLKVGSVVHYIDQDDIDAVNFPVVGYAVPDIEISIGELSGKHYEDNVIGSILMRGPTVTQGYYDEAEATGQVMDCDGWFDTGDLGFISDGELVITGRSKEIIFAHGQNYYPHDLESILIHQMGIELGKVAAWGIWDEQQQRDRLVLFIIYRGDLESFIPLANKSAAILNEQAGLEVDVVIPVNRIPKTTSGKFQRRILGDDYENGEFDEVLRQISLLKSAENKADDNRLGSTEEVLKNLCNSVLENTEITSEDNFFEIGISSLVLAEIHQKIDEIYPGKTDITDLFEHQTIRDLSSFIESKESLKC